MIFILLYKNIYTIKHTVSVFMFIFIWTKNCL